MSSRGRQLQVSLDPYLAHRLGPGTGPQMALNMVARSFTATTLGSFWRYWNAGFQFYLLTYVYRPLRGFLDRKLALLLTFALCGLAHDVFLILPITLVSNRAIPFPFVTTWFLIIGISILMTEQLDWKLDALSRGFRVAVHAAFLIATFTVTLGVAKLW